MLLLGGFKNTWWSLFTWASALLSGHLELGLWWEAHLPLGRGSGVAESCRRGTTETTQR